VPYDPTEPEARLVLSANESPLTLPAPLLARIKAGMPDFSYRRYPDPLATALREALAAEHGLSSENVLVGNGGDELLLDLMLAWGGPGRSFLNLPPSFAMYAIYAQLTETRLIDLPRDPETFAVNEADALARLAQGDLDLCILANPNNPSGNLCSEEFLCQLCEASDALVVVDEAYAEFSGATLVPRLAHYPNLVLLRTFSKAFSLAGLRLGYVLAHPPVIRTLMKVRMPYSVNAFSQWVGELVLDERASFEPTLALLRAERERVFTALKGLASYGVQVWPSAANFLLFRVPNATSVWQQLLDDYGIYLRNFAGAPGLSDCLRASIGTPEQNKTFLQALTKIVSNS
jgi:histidinol-phosphate aminotransferase